MERDKLIQFLSEQSINKDTQQPGKGVTATRLSDTFQMNRSVASRLLNDLFHRKEVIKVNSRPVLFFERKTLENYYDKVIETFVFKSIDALKSYFSITENTFDPFESFIGDSMDTKNMIEQCKTAISYPPSGLPILLTGDSGVGKSYLAKLIYDYAAAKAIIPEDGKFITFNCAEYADNPDLITAKLFGHVKGAFTGADSNKNGVVEAANNGVLFLDEAHRLSFESQEKLFLLMDKGVYNPLGNSDVERKTNVRVILATTENPSEAFLPTFTRRIPVIIDLPSLHQISLKNKQALIKKFYRDESKRINKTLDISKDVVYTLFKYDPPGNIGGLRNVIIFSCASALQENSQADNNISINIRHFPEHLIKLYADNKYYLHYQFKHILLDSMIIDYRDSTKLSDKHLSETENIINHLFTEIQTKVKQHQDIPFSVLVEDVNKYLDTLQSFSILERSEQKVNTIEKLLFNVLKVYDYIFYSQQTILKIAKYIIYRNESFSTAADEEGTFRKLLEGLKHVYPREFNQANLIKEELENVLGMQINLLDLNIIILFLRGFEKLTDNKGIKSIIVCHGENTASSIANVANRLLGKYLFQGFDMPIEVSVSEVIEKITLFLKTIDNSSDIIIFVDMGSLIQLSDRLENSFKGTIGLVNNVTTSMVIEAGEKILQNKPIHDILAKMEEQVPQYQIIEPPVTKKENVIITTCDTGIGTAMKFKELLDRIFKDIQNIDVIAYDYSSLKHAGTEANYFNEYNILGIVGSLDPGIEGIPFVAIEDIISGNNQFKWYEILEAVLTESEISILNDKLLKQFSTQSVLDHITILNPEKIINHVEKTLSLLQEMFQVELSNSSKISLYIHISCLIERLVKQQPIEVYTDLESFKQSHHEFIRGIKKAFIQLENVYNISLPISEIGYIFDIIKHNHPEFSY
ncbi:sigma 54-interacting transcriptional regulator [Oceanobacillus sp. CFH 90083]|uniref:sigma 54-interacting transcriptional regulator n=1 Tax=Oceanobacillus sp. CFH 90083 TaxID=2592336 RepID=UPI00188350C1|nr:sigma 54-interacting transcriptional regulator [Oceanobacillus sp. CFH 90083]